jgi:branched-chain amino acid transport system ATP-binding protein
MLIVKNLTKRFGGFTAVDDVTLEIKEGEIISIIGTNGAGKTTLVNMISGYLKPDSGTILFLNNDITHASPYVRIKLGVGRSFQLIQLFENSTALDNVRIALFSKYGMIRRGLLPADRYTSVTDEAMEILRNFNILDKKHLTPKALSEGDMKILDVAIAFALKSRLLLLDEPTSGVATQISLKSWIRLSLRFGEKISRPSSLSTTWISSQDTQTESLSCTKAGSWQRASPLT